VFVNLKLNHIQHVGLPVSNLEISEAFYRKLGFANVMASGFDYQGGRGSVVMMRRGEMILELYQLPEAQLQEIRNRKDGHIDHIAFDVDSIYETFAALKSEDFTIIEDAPVFLPFWNKGCRYFNILGPDGERLEFNQILMDPLR
jgi:catechol 2,3-dioxygenase-like lactoylglutathione lyase family enzyme